MQLLPIQSEGLSEAHRGPKFFVGGLYLAIVRPFSGLLGALLSATYRVRITLGWVGARFWHAVCSERTQSAWLHFTFDLEAGGWHFKVQNCHGCCGD